MWDLTCQPVVLSLALLGLFVPVKCGVCFLPSVGVICVCSGPVQYLGPLGTLAFLCWLWAGGFLEPGGAEA